MKRKINKLITNRIKIGRKLIRHITYSILIIGISISIWLILFEKKKIISLETQNIIFTSKSIANVCNALFEDLYKTASALNSSITKRVTTTDNPPPSLFDTQKIKRSSDGSIRCDDGYSGAFLAKGSKLNDGLLRHFFFSKRAFDLLGEIARTHFFNYYFITKENFIRISPKDWAFQIEPDHDFKNDIFYKIALPENNPDKIPVWTPIYYDSIWKKWMTSIIIPVYDNDEFVGVTGNDVFLDTIFNKIMGLKTELKSYSAVLFDSDGNLIVYPKYKDKILKKTAEMNSLLNINDLNDPLLSKIIAQTIRNNNSHDKISIIQNNSDTYYFSSQKIAVMDWYLCIYKSKSEILNKFHPFIFKILAVFIILGFITILTLFLFLKK